MDIEKRVTNLENMMANVIKNMSNQKFYTDADISGARKNINETSEIANKVEKSNALTEETVDDIMTEVIPTLTEKDESLTTTIDSILTDIIPSLMGE